MGLFDRLRGEDEPRVAFFGIDGVPYSLIADNPDDFENLTELAQEGSAGAIDSITPPESSACWPSLTTGKNPGETGVYGFQDREVGSYDTYVPMGRDVRVDRIWDRVQEAGRDATVMNVPVTFPPQRNVQRMVSGFLSPGLDKSAYPGDLREYLESIDYRIDANPKLGHRDDKSAFIEDAHETLDARFEAFEHYVEEDDWDLFFGVFMTPDRVNHFLFKHYEEDGEYKEEFIEFYRKLDRYLGTLREKLSDDVTMIVASDHGFTRLDYEVHFNEWLQQEGWLDYRNDYAFRLNLWLKRQESVEHGETVYAEDDPREAGLEVGAADPTGDDVAVVVAEDEVAKNRVVEGLRDATADQFGAEDDRELVDSLETTETPDGFHVTVQAADGVVLEDDTDADDVLGPGHGELGDISDDTKAYSLIPGRFYLNLEGREPRGSVPEDEYEDVRDELKEKLESLEGPDGRKVADRVVEKEEAFRGDHEDIAPDLVVIPNHGFDLKAGFKGHGDVFASGPRNGMHSFDNASLFIDDLRADVADTDLYDIAPTILDLMEMEFDRAEFDGASLI